MEPFRLGIWVRKNLLPSTQIEARTTLLTLMHSEANPEGDAQLAESNETHSAQPMSPSQQLEWLLVPSDQPSNNICVPITGSKLTVGLVNVTDLGPFLFPFIGEFGGNCLRGSLR
ncbi:hypothetical protein CDAR_580891 [Caerostris darwini]|uniref:Uncharacterized protein n=1 Tax=Caerostris darwini TaxID=1538125 RepID=A0AAV4WN88_9ARAC|nr:hypothetical protein CDAR_580891 [Caerostris darwini]